MKILFRRIHLYLALAAGLVFFLQCLTGTLLVFEEELTRALHPERYAVAAAPGQARLPLGQLVASFQQARPQAKVQSVRVYRDAARPVEVTFKGPPRPGQADGPRPEGRREGPDGKMGRGEKGGRGGKGGKGGRDRGDVAFINPYTGQVAAVLSPKEATFLGWVEDFHRTLLAGEIGKTLTGLSALFTLVITATGVVLWWPKTRQIMRQRLQVKWGSSGKRLTHDLHVVLGFYCALVLFGLAGTGVFMSYRWATQSLFWLTNSQPRRVAPLVAGPAPAGPATVGLDAALRAGQAAFGQAESWRVAPPRDPAAALVVTAPSPEPLHRLGNDSLFLNQYSGAVLGQRLYRDQPAGMQARRYMRPLHTGTFGGLATKILVFVVSLLGITFPITGVLMWRNRVNKQNKRGAAARPLRPA